MQKIHFADAVRMWLYLQKPDMCKYFQSLDEPIHARRRSIIPGLLKRVNQMEETIQKSRRREKIMICIILMLAMLLMISVTGKKRGHTIEEKLEQSLE